MFDAERVRMKPGFDTSAKLSVQRFAQPAVFARILRTARRNSKKPGFSRHQPKMT
ncbi:MAG: hypothetical protein WBL95_12885 [Microcoleus sp.]